MKLTGENRSTRRKTCPSATLSITNPTWTDPGSSPSLHGERPANNRLSHDTAYIRGITVSICWEYRLTALRDYLFSAAVRLVMEPFQPPIQWVPGALSSGLKLNTNPHLEPRLRLGGAIPPLLHMPRCLEQGQLYINFSSNGSIIACVPSFPHLRSQVPDRDTKAIWRFVSY
jgi:hypothetical protein